MRAAIDSAAMKKRIRYGTEEHSGDAKSSCAKKRVCGAATRRAGSSDCRSGAGSNYKPDGRAVMGKVHGLDIVSEIYFAPRQRPSPGTTNQLIVSSLIEEAVAKRRAVLASDLDF